MFKKQLILFAAAVLLLIGFFILPRNKEWGKRILTYYKEFQTDKNRLSHETRMRTRFGSSYTLSKGIAAELIQKGGNRDALILVPPPAYFTNRGIDYPMPEPSVFYYYTDIKTTWCHFTNAMDADWYVRVDQGKVVVDRVIDKKSLQDTIAAFIKWKRAYE